MIHIFILYGGEWVYLKAIELSGFKSFAIRTRLELNKGLTAIVGPNGSGKSNLTDAVRWVLGEQSSRSLRGQQMGDLIFSGSSEHRAVGMAEVTLLFDNSDYQLAHDFSEIAITRRLFRDGQSEYLINNKSCRLRDIVDLFTDTGLGRESFAIIGQGQIDQILDERPEQRRGIFEEAAGIAGYRQRKQEVERRLIKVGEQLVRVTDMLTILQENAVVLEAQAAEALEYLGAQADLKFLERGVYVHDILDLEQRLVKAKAEAKQANDSFLTQQTEFVLLESAQEKHRVSLDKADESEKEAQQMLWSSRQEMERLLGEKRLLELKATQRVEEAERRRQEIAQHEQELAQQDGVIYNLENEASVLRWQHSEAEAELAQLMEAYKVCQARLSELLRIEKERRSLLEQQNKDAARMESMLEQLLLRSESLNQSLEIVNTQKLQIVEEQDKAIELEQRAQTALNSVQRELTELQESESEIHILLSKQEDQQKQKRAEVDQLRQQMVSLQARLKMLKEMEEQREGYQRAVQQLLITRDKGQGLNGLIDILSRVIEVPSHLELAIEAALGGASQNLLCESEKDAEEAIAWLKNNRAGRATFLPLDAQVSLSNREIRVDSKVPGYLGLAADLVITNERYKPVVNRQLGRILVFNDLDSALGYARQNGYRERIVTLQGELLVPGGAITGGSSQRRENSLLARPRLLSDLGEEQVSLEVKLRENQQVLGRFNLAVDQTRAKQNELLTMINQKEQRKAVLSEQMYNILSRNKELTSREDQNQAEVDRYEDLIQQIRKEVKEIEAHLPTLQQQKSKQNDDIRLVWLEQEALRENEKQLLAKKSALEANLEQKKLFIGQNVEKLKTIRDNQKRIRDQITALIDLHTQALLDEEKQTVLDKTLNQQLLDEENRQLEKEEQLQGLLETKSSISQEIATQDQKITQQKRLLDRATRRLNEAEMQVVRSEDELNYLTRNLVDGQQMNITELKETMIVPLLERYHQAESIVITAETSHEQHYAVLLPWLKEQKPLFIQKMQQRRQELVALGQVNLAAIEEVKLLKERITEVTDQSNDLVQARVELRELITNLEMIMSRLFRETVFQVGVIFEQLFQQLFAGGDASLSLENEGNPLEGGVEIQVKLPGKKTASLALFSGGERALVALALLLAISQVKEPPFCLLDEVETALDESNLERLASLFATLAQSYQIMVITHRRPTMEAADALIGITMQTKGVSTALAVDLQQIEEQVGLQ